MNSIIKKTVLTLFVGLFFLQAGIYAQDTIGTTPSKTTRSENSKFEFPEVKGWKKVETQYPRDSGLGEMANYDSEDGGRITLYFYDGGRNLIPDDLDSKILKEEMKNAKLGILQLGEMGAYKNIKEAKNDTVALGGSSGKVKALHSLLYFTAGENELVSEIFIFPYKNSFLKVRATRPKEKEKNKTFEAFMTEIDTFFSK